MTARALYNEIDPAAAAVLRQCIADGVIAPGRVETRSIKELTADDLADAAQVHLFAGGGLWSVAARLAGWPDDRPLWSASCPCQPFSQAGQGRGVDDPRHLWPDVDRLLDGLARSGQLPPVIVGEQVAGAAGYAWFDGVRADLARKGYRARVVDIPACAVDAPHIRQRLYWVAVRDVADAYWSRPSALGRDAGEIGGLPVAQCRAEDDAALFGRGHGAFVDNVVHPARIGRGEGRPEHELRRRRAAPAGADASGVTLGDAFVPRLEGQPRHGDGEAGRALAHRPVAAPDGGLLHADADRGGCAGRPQGEIGSALGRAAAERDLPRVNGSFWADAEWIACHDGKARRAKPGLRLLVDGLPGRVDLWRIGGNAIVPELAAQVLAALMDALDYEGATP
jgi:DNA (cytosine-5)-methyltransferase 1